MYTEKYTIQNERHIWEPKSVVSYLCNEKGGITGATSCSELPHNRCQVTQAYNSKCRSTSNNSSNCSGRADPILDLIQQCRVDLTPGGRKFNLTILHALGMPKCMTIHTEFSMSHVMES